MSTPGTLVVAMSGGVDSSVAAALLLEAGWNLIGMTLRLVTCDDPSRDRFCCGLEAEHQASLVADQLGFPHYVLDASLAFDAAVLAPAWREYSHGRTPSPCLWCNRELKFGLLLERARRLGAEGVATGHYAQRETKGGEPALLRGVDEGKDQSYFLFALGRERLARAHFPLGNMHKAEVRARAAALGLACATRRASQDACLLGPDGGSFAEALRGRFEGGACPGAILDMNGRTIGMHDGVHRFTIGQRRGLGVALGRPAWVTAIDAERAEVTLTTSAGDLLSHGLVARDPTWLVPVPAAHQPWACQAQVRYRARPAPATAVCTEDGAVMVSFQDRQRAVTPGQAVVLYQGERVLGGAWIEAPLAGTDPISLAPSPGAR